MGLLDKVSDGLKKGVQSVNDEIKRRQEIKQAKYDILEKFTIYDIKKMNRDYGIGQPSNYEENYFSGERTRITLDRDDYVSYAANNLTLEQIKHYSEKKRNKGSDNIVKHNENVETSQLKNEISLKKEMNVVVKSDNNIKPKQVPQPSFNELEDIFKVIREFKPEEIVNEKDFEKQLTIYLKTKYHDKVERQYVSTKGKIDIVIDKKYAFELKIADNKGVLRNLKGQVQDYKKVFNNVTVVLLDVNKVSDSVIQEFILDCKEHGIKTIKIKGVLKKGNTKSKQINIKY